MNLQVTASAQSGIKFWSVRSPHLYTVTVEVVAVPAGVGGMGTPRVVDSTNVTTGVRTVEFNARAGLFVNRENVKMRGFCDHSNFGGTRATGASAGAGVGTECWYWYWQWYWQLYWCW